MWEKTIRPNRR
nr:unnamed protein product [Callosobruchus chinensis]